MEQSSAREAIAQLRNLPTLPTILGQVLDTASDPEASALDLGRHIAVDQSLTATVLRLVNSAYYGIYHEITSVTRAIVMLGFSEVRNLVLTATAFRSLSGSRSQYDRRQLWRHSMAVAMGAGRLAKVTTSAQEGDGFVAGLLHDIGKVALDKLYPEQFWEAAGKAHEQERFVRDVEREMFGLDHAEAGGVLAEHWGLPQPIADAIRWHHAPEMAPRDAALVRVAAVADFVAYEASLGEWSNGRDPECPDGSMEGLGVTKDQWVKVVWELQESSGKIDEFLGALPAP